ncbi:flagellar hook-associated protein FlgL [Orrella sp. JC864]|uniref:flagellar hook-associated protein FlgL n=1 Tax=Orrella sp. JC864 TaxID=3120298 RepID=UPI0012BB4F9F
MRISTSQIFRTGINTINAQQSDLMHLYQQIGTGRRIVTPADDPLAAAQAVNLAQSDAVNTRYGRNRDVAVQNLSIAETVLNTVTLGLQDLRTTLVEAGNGTYSDADRRSLADELRVMRDNLVAQANATDGNGQYLFSGYRGDVQPYVFDQATGQVTYHGDAGQRLIQVDQTRQMAAGDVGSDIFSRATPGSNAYLSLAAPGNTGTATIGMPQLTDPGGVAPGTRFTIAFAGDPLQYTVTTVDNSVVPPVSSVSAPQDYTGAGTIDLGGVSVAIGNGPPAPGDSFEVLPAQSADLDLFATLDQVIKALETPADGDPVAQAALNNTLNSALQRVAINYDNVLTVRASQGARLAELEAISNAGSERGLNFKKQLSNLQDVDYYAASASLSLRQAALEAATLAFRRIQSTSLFAVKGGG